MINALHSQLVVAGEASPARLDAVATFSNGLSYCILLAVVTLSCAFGQPVINGVLNSASYLPILAPGSLASVFGNKLTVNLASAKSVPLPTELDNVSVLVGGVPAPLLFVSPDQINLLIPIGTPTGTVVAIVVRNGLQVSTTFNVTMRQNAPALFTRNYSGTGDAVAFDASFTPVDSVNGSLIVLYATGLGPTEPFAVSPTFSLDRVRDQVTVTVGELPAEVLFAGLAPGLPGVYQINIVPPKAAQSNRLWLSVSGTESNVVSLPIPVGTNVSNVSAAIEGMFPASGTFFTQAGSRTTAGPIQFSVMLTAAAAAVSFDILPNAKPFTVTATSPAGNTVLKIDPNGRNWTASVLEPFGAPRIGDFSSFPGFPVIDLQSGMYMPGNVVPASRFDGVAYNAMLNMPLPSSSTFTRGNPNGFFEFTGSPIETSRFSFGNPGDLTKGAIYFGGYIFIGQPPPSTRSVDFNLFVDGLLVASKKISFQVY